MILNNHIRKNNIILYNNNEKLSQSYLSEIAWSFSSQKVIKLKSKVENSGKKIKYWKGINIYRGIVTGLNKAFIINEEIKKEMMKEDKKVKDYIKPMTKGRNLKRYYLKASNEYLLLIKPNSIIINVIKYHLEKYKKKLSKRWEPRHGKIKWWELRPCVYYHEFETPKIIYPDISDEGGFYWDEGNYFFNNTIYMICGAPKYWIGILNSKLINKYYKLIATNLGDKGVRYFTQFVELIPIVEIKNADKLDNLVSQMLESKKQLHSARTDKDKSYYERKCRRLDKQIDSEVYKLYDLTEEEIKIVEGSE